MPASIWTPFFEEIKVKKKRDDVRKREVERRERETTRGYSEEKTFGKREEKD